MYFQFWCKKKNVHIENSQILLMEISTFVYLSKFYQNLLWLIYNKHSLFTQIKNISYFIFKTSVFVTVAV